MSRPARACRWDLISGNRLEVAERAGSRQVQRAIRSWCAPGWCAPTTSPRPATARPPPVTVVDHLARLPREGRARLIDGLAHLLWQKRREVPDLGPEGLFRLYLPEVFHLCLEREEAPVAPASPRAREAMLLGRAHFRLRGEHAPPRPRAPPLHVRAVAGRLALVLWYQAEATPRGSSAAARPGLVRAGPGGAGGLLAPAAAARPKPTFEHRRRRLAPPAGRVQRPGGGRPRCPAPGYPRRCPAGRGPEVVPGRPGSRGDRAAPAGAAGRAGALPTLAGRGAARARRPDAASSHRDPGLQSRLAVLLRELEERLAEELPRLLTISAG